MGLVGFGTALVASGLWFHALPNRHSPVNRIARSFAPRECWVADLIRPHRAVSPDAQRVSTADNRYGKARLQRDDPIELPAADQMFNYPTCVSSQALALAHGKFIDE